MTILNQLFELIRRLRNGILLWGLLFLAGTSAFLIWDFYLEVPPFLLAIGEKVAADPNVLHAIGEQRGWAYAYDSQELAATDTASFSYTLTGRCDSAYCKVIGYYYKSGDRLIGVATDTIIKSNCP